MLDRSGFADRGLVEQGGPERAEGRDFPTILTLRQAILLRAISIEARPMMSAGASEPMRWVLSVSFLRRPSQVVRLVIVEYFHKCHILNIFRSFRVSGAAQAD